MGTSPDAFGAAPLPRGLRDGMLELLDYMATGGDGQLRDASEYRALARLMATDLRAALESDSAHPRRAVVEVDRAATGNSRIDVILVEESPLMRDALASGIEADPRTRVTAMASSARGLLDALIACPCDVVLLDEHLANVDGVDLIERIIRLHPVVRVVVLATSGGDATVRSAMHAGASGFLLRRQVLGEIVDGICSVDAGGTVLAPQVATNVVPGLVPSGNGTHGALLDPIELEVLRRVAHGATDMQVARALYVSPRTVQNQLARIRAKAGVQRRTELASWAYENDLV